MKHARGATGLALLLAIWMVPAACVDRAGGDTEQASSRAETGQQDEDASGQEPPSSPEEARAWMESHLPRWRVFFAGEPYAWKLDDHTMYWLEPGTIDAFCPLVLVPQDRRGHDLGTGEWIHLNARALRDEGMAYFTKRVVEKYNLSILDLAVIQYLLSQGIDSIPVVPVSTPSDAGDDDTQFLYEEGPPPGIPGDWGPDNHTVGPGPFGGGGSRPPPPSWVPPRPPPPRGHGGAPHPQRPRPWPKPPPPRRPARRSPNGDPGGYSARDIWNGLKREDHPEGNYPGWDDPKRDQKDLEVFRCQGHVYVGYRNMCPDYSFFPPDRWNKIIGELLKLSKSPDWDKTPEWKLHAFWHDGKKPECLKDAERNARNLCGGAYLAGLEGCIMTPGCIAVATSARGLLGLGIATEFVVPECKTWITDYAEKNICTR